MTPPTAHRAPLLDLPTHLDRPDRANEQFGHPVTDAQAFLFEHSTLNGLRYCAPVYRCKKRICPRCSTNLAARARDDLRTFAELHPHALFVVLAVESSSTIETAWADLATTRNAFMAGGWLTSRSTSWMRITEMTHSPDLWNVHDNIVVFGTAEEQELLLSEIKDRWLAAAARAGVHASVHAQHAGRARSSSRVFNYASKGLMRPSTDPDHGDSMGDLLAAYQQGDADAAQAWHELETWWSTSRARWTARGGDLRVKKKKWKAAPAPARASTKTRGPKYTIEYLDLERFKSLTRAEQMRELGCCRSSVYNAIERAELELCA